MSTIRLRDGRQLGYAEVGPPDGVAVFVFHPTGTSRLHPLGDALAIERFAVLGISDGGPGALACGFAFPARVTRVGLASSPGPYWDVAELEDLLPVGGERRRLIELARSDAAAAEAFARGDAVGFEPDSPETREAVRTGIDGLIEEVLVNYTRAWGYDPRDILMPVHIWHGELDDEVPVAVAAWLARRIPRGELHVIPGEGHFADEPRLEEILRTVAR